jgi:ABC-type nitrate/sulfonate/bicarbonate transport system substrate-binding protein
VPALTVGAVSRNYFNMPLWIAQHAGFFNQEGLSVTIELIEGIDEVTRRLVDGRFHLALNVTENTILNSEQGGRLEIIADLRGARIGVSSINAGSSSLIMRLLASHGLLHPRDYTLVPVGPILARWKMLLSGEIDAGLQGAPLNYVAVDAGFTDLGNPRTQFPDFQFTSLDADRDWAKRNETVVVRFLRAYIQAHHWFYENKGGATQIAQKEMSVDRHYAERAWADYVCDEIFPRDGRASVRGVQTLLTVSALIRDLAARSRTRAEQYINHSYLEIAARG